MCGQETTVGTWGVNAEMEKKESHSTRYGGKLKTLLAYKFKKTFTDNEQA